MRLWTLHPGYLDSAGLVALWREGLLAQAVLLGKTSGYVNHPQIYRFRLSADPLAAIGSYLREVLAEGIERGFAFQAAKIRRRAGAARLLTSAGQLGYERRHLLAKLKARNAERYRRLEQDLLPKAHPLFSIVAGGIEPWEKTKEFSAAECRQAGGRR